MDGQQLELFARDGGTLRNADGHETRVRWYAPAGVAGTLAERQALVAKLVKVRAPRRRKTFKIDLAAIERAGAAALAEPDRRGYVRGANWLVRIYYRSEGGEILAFDAGPYRQAGADMLRDEYVRERETRQAKVGESRGATVYKPCRGASFALDAEIMPVREAEQRKPLHGARLVRLPSQGGALPERAPNVKPERDVLAERVAAALPDLGSIQAARKAIDEGNVRELYIALRLLENDVHRAAAPRHGEPDPATIAAAKTALQAFEARLDELGLVLVDDCRLARPTETYGEYALFRDRGQVCRRSGPRSYDELHDLQADTVSGAWAEVRARANAATSDVPWCDDGVAHNTAAMVKADKQESERRTGMTQGGRATRYSEPFELDGDLLRLVCTGESKSPGYDTWTLQRGTHAASCPCARCWNVHARLATVLGQNSAARVPVLRWTSDGYVLLRFHESALELAGERLLGHEHGVALELADGFA